MANEIRIPISVIGGPAAAREIKGVGKAADEAGDDLGGLAKDASALDKALVATESRVASLRMELAKDPGDRGLRKQVRAEERELNYLTRLKKAITPADASATGREIGKHVTGGIADTFGALPAQLKGAGIAIGAALAIGAAPAIGGVIAGAVLGGVGIGGIAGGIAAAAQDQRVKAAGTHLADTLKANFADVGEPFIEPLITQMSRLEGVGATFFSDLSADIAPLAGHLDNLTDGLAGAARNLDLSKAATAAGPVLDMIGTKLPDAADALTNALDSIADGGEGAAHALGEVFDGLEGGIEVTGRLVGELAKIEPYVTTGGSALLDLVDKLNEEKLPLGLLGWIEKIDQTGDAAIRARGSADELNDGLDDVAQTARATSKEVVGLSDSFGTLFGKQMSLDEANAAYKQGMRDLKEELTDGRRTLDENTQAGLDNAGAVRDQIQVIEDLRQAQFDQNGNLQEANATYDHHIAQLKTTLVNLGYNKAEIEKLIGAYQRLPKDGVDITIRSPGLWTALQRVRELARLLGSYAAGRNAAEGSEPVSGRASGGPVQAGKPYLVGEEGPELVTFAANGTVHTAAETAALLAGSSGGSAVPAASGGPTTAQMAAAIKAALNGVAVVMDGRIVGRVQAAEADIYARA